MEPQDGKLIMPITPTNEKVDEMVYLFTSDHFDPDIVIKDCKGHVATDRFDFNLECFSQVCGDGHGGVGAFRAELITPIFRRKLMTELNRLVTMDQRLSAGICLHSYMSEFGNKLLHRVQPLFQKLFAHNPVLHDNHGNKLDKWRSVYLNDICVVTYDSKKHPHIDSHTDDCDITINLCLQNSDQGGELYYEPDGESKTTIEQIPGYAVIGLGTVTHGTNPVIEGVRTNIVFKFKFVQPEAAMDLQSFHRFQETALVIKRQIVGYLDLPSLAKFRRSHKSAVQITDDYHLWKSLYQTHQDVNAWISVEELIEGKHIQKCEDASTSPLFSLMMNEDESTYKNEVVLVDDDWYNALKAAVNNWAIVRLLRQRQISPRLMRATIGCYMPRRRLTGVYINPFN